VNAFDLSSAPEPCFTSLHGVTSVTTIAGEELAFREFETGLIVDARAVDRHAFGTRYRVGFGAVREQVRVRNHSNAAGALSALLAAAGPGDVCDVPDGRYDDEPFPIVIPAGVTLRGGSAARVVIDAGGKV